jgi:hypothetical protein
VNHGIETVTISQTTDRMSSPNAPVQIVKRVSGRRIWSNEQKLAIMGEAFSLGA